MEIFHVHDMQTIPYFYLDLRSGRSCITDLYYYTLRQYLTAFKLRIQAETYMSKSLNARYRSAIIWQRVIHKVEKIGNPQETVSIIF